MELLAANHGKFFEIGVTIPTKFPIISAQNLTKILFI
jgi:hypothetical protein